MRRSAATAAELNAWEPTTRACQHRQPKALSWRPTSKFGGDKFVVRIFVAMTLAVLPPSGVAKAQIAQMSATLTDPGAKFIVTAAPEPYLNPLDHLRPIPDLQDLQNLESPSISSVIFDWTPCLEDVGRLTAGTQIISFTVKYTPAYGAPPSPLRLGATLTPRVSVNRTLPAVLYTACLVAEFRDGSRREIFQQSAISSPLPPSLITYVAIPTALELRYAPPRSGYGDAYDRSYYAALYDYYIEYERVGYEVGHQPTDRNYIYSNATALRIRRLAPDASYTLRVYARLGGVPSIIPMRLDFRTPAFHFAEDGRANVSYSSMSHPTGDQMASVVAQYPTLEPQYSTVFRPEARLYFVPTVDETSTTKQQQQQKPLLGQQKTMLPYDKRLILQEQPYLQSLQQQQQKEKQQLLTQQQKYDFVVQQNNLLKSVSNQNVASKNSPTYGNLSTATVDQTANLSPSTRIAQYNKLTTTTVATTVGAKLVTDEKSSKSAVIATVTVTPPRSSTDKLTTNIVDHSDTVTEESAETVDVGRYGSAPLVNSAPRNGKRHENGVDEMAKKDEDEAAATDRNPDLDWDQAEMIDERVTDMVEETALDERGLEEENDNETEETDEEANEYRGMITVHRVFDDLRRPKLRVEWHAPESTLCDEFAFNHTVRRADGKGETAGESTRTTNTSSYVNYVKDAVISVQVFCMLEGVLSAGAWSARREIDLRRPAPVSNLRVADAQTDAHFVASVRLAFDRPAGHDPRYYRIHVTWALGKKVVGTRDFLLRRGGMNMVRIDSLQPSRLYTFTVRNASREVDELISSAVGLRQTTRGIILFVGSLAPAISSTLTADAVGASAALVRFDATDPTVHSFDHYELVFVGGPTGRNVTRTVAKHATRRSFNFTQLAAGRIYRFVLYTVTRGGQRSRPVVAETTTYPLKVERFVAVCGPGYAVLHWQTPGMPRDDAAGHFLLSYSSRANNGEARTSRDVRVNGTARSHKFTRLEPDAYYTFSITVVSADGAVASDAVSVTVGFAGRPRFMPILKRYGSRELVITFENDRHTFPDLNGVINDFAIIVAEEVEDADDGFDLRSWHDVHTRDVRPAYRTSPADYHPFRRRGAPKLAAFVIGEENCDEEEGGDGGNVSGSEDAENPPNVGSSGSNQRRRYCNGPLAPRVDYFAKVRAYSVANVAMETDWVAVYEESDNDNQKDRRHHGGYGAHSRRRPCHMYLNGCDDEDEEPDWDDENSDSSGSLSRSTYSVFGTTSVALITVWMARPYRIP